MKPLSFQQIFKIRNTEVFETIVEASQILKKGLENWVMNFFFVAQ
jgi:hypothetical protein